MTDTARKFAKGDRVRMTERGIQQLAQRKGQPTTGVVVGFGRSILSVYVLRDGRKRMGRYHVAFWEKAK
jgi:hypothetical protein